MRFGWITLSVLIINLSFNSVKNVQLGIPPGGERSVDIHFIRPFVEIIRPVAEYH